MADVFDSERTALRAEFRHRRDAAFSRGDDNIPSTGRQFAFGRIAAVTAAPLDDRDGVPDDRDACPNTMAGVAVNANGCERDAHGVVDRMDRCPGTRAGAAVDTSGCEIREEIPLPGVNFATNSDVLPPSATDVLEDAAQMLRNNPTIVVEVAAHTDSDGSEARNQSLSERRAIAVRGFFVNAGIAANRLTARGYGESEPVADNATQAGKA